MGKKFLLRVSLWWESVLAVGYNINKPINLCSSEYRAGAKLIGCYTYGERLDPSDCAVLPVPVATIVDKTTDANG